MCGAGPHAGGDLFRSLCRLADRFRACAGDAEAAKIGGALSALALHASRSGDRDFRYALGSFLMDLALQDEEALPRGAPVPYETAPRGRP
jgi:hypothetical protein